MDRIGMAVVICVSFFLAFICLFHGLFYKIPRCLYHCFCKERKENFDFVHVTDQDRINELKKCALPHMKGHEGFADDLGEIVIKYLS